MNAHKEIGFGAFPLFIRIRIVRQSHHVRLMILYLYMLILREGEKIIGIYAGKDDGGQALFLRKK